MTGSKVSRGAQHRQRETCPPQRALVPPQAFLPPSTSNLLFHITKTPVRSTWDQGLRKLCPVSDPGKVADGKSEEVPFPCTSSPKGFVSGKPDPPNSESREQRAA